MRIYLAAPYTQGDVGVNIHKVLEVADRLIAKGHTPYIPHLTHFWHIYSPKSYAFWLNYDNSFILHWAEALLRLGGDSGGADREELIAYKKGLIIYHNEEDIPSK